MAKEPFRYDTVFMKAGLDILQKIKDNEKVTVGKLADLRDRRYGNTSNYTTQMEENGYIRKEYVDGMGKKKIMSLTDKGREVLEASEYA